MDRFDHPAHQSAQTTLDVISQLIREGSPLKIWAFDADRNERASTALKNFVTQNFGRGSIATTILPHPTKAGCTIVLNIGAIPRGDRELLIEKLATTPLGFSIGPPPT